MSAKPVASPLRLFCHTDGSKRLYKKSRSINAIFLHSSHSTRRDLLPGGMCQSRWCLIHSMYGVPSQLFPIGHPVHVGVVVFGSLNSIHNGHCSYPLSSFSPSEIAFHFWVPYSRVHNVICRVGFIIIFPPLIRPRAGLEYRLPGVFPRYAVAYGGRMGSQSATSASCPSGNQRRACPSTLTGTKGLFFKYNIAFAHIHNKVPPLRNSISQTFKGFPKLIPYARWNGWFNYQSISLFLLLNFYYCLFSASLPRPVPDCQYIPFPDTFSVFRLQPRTARRRGRAFRYLSVNLIRSGRASTIVPLLSSIIPIV